MHRDEINSLQIQLSRTQAGPGRAVKEQQEQNSPNPVQRINLISVCTINIITYCPDLSRLMASDLKYGQFLQGYSILNSNLAI